MSSLDSTSATKEVDVSRRPDYLEDQITWSRPKVGQITWARSIGGAGLLAALAPSRTRAPMEAAPSEQLLVGDGRRRQRRSGRRSAGSAAYAMQRRDADGYLSDGRARAESSRGSPRAKRAEEHG